METGDAVVITRSRSKPAGVSKAREPGLGALVGAAEHRHHLQIDEVVRLPSSRRIGLQDLLDDEQPPIRTHGCATRTQNAQRVLVRPVMEHADQQIDVGSGRHSVEEVAALHADAATCAPFGRNRRHHVVAIEDDAARIGKPGQNATERLAIAAPDVGDQSGLREWSKSEEWYPARIPRCRTDGATGLDPLS
jgi:hypothetical protein